MKIKICLMVAVLLLIGTVVYAANGDLLVTGNIGIGTTTPKEKLDVRGLAIAQAMIERTGFVDLAKGITPTITSGSSLGEGGPTNRGKNSAWNISSFPSSLTLDLFQAGEGNQIGYICFGTSWRTSTNLIPKNYSIDYSVDGVNWINIVTVQNNSDPFVMQYNVNTWNSSPRYVRLTVSAPQTGQNVAVVSGLQVLSYQGAALYGDNPWAALEGDTFLAMPGNVGIGAINTGGYKLYVNGPFYASSGPWSTSDIKYKKNIVPIADSLANVLNLNGISFEWKVDEYKDKGFPEGRHYGVIAQDIEKVLPEVVKTSSDGSKSVAYTEIIPVLIEAIKEQQKQIELLKTEIKDLQNQSFH